MAKSIKSDLRIIHDIISEAEELIADDQNRQAIITLEDAKYIIQTILKGK